MRLMINHQTHYHYSAPACNSIQYIKMTPPNNAHQQVHHWAISVPGESEIKQDAFQNIWMTSTQRFSYQSLSIMAQGIVELRPQTRWGLQDQLNPYLFLQPTVSTLCSPEMQCFARQYVPQVNRDNLIRLSEAILSHMPYRPAQTSVQTTAIEAFQAKQGVCQDHAHVLIAMCKSLGIPARYVSGYLYSSNSSHLASHAWVEVFLEQHWFCFDVSNLAFQPDSHVYLAIGRDYWDVAPVRGVREKGGIEHMQTMVQVLAC